MRGMFTPDASRTCQPEGCKSVTGMSTARYCTLKCQNIGPATTMQQHLPGFCAAVEGVDGHSRVTTETKEQ